MPFAKFEQMTPVYNRHNPAVCGFVLTTYRKLDGTVCCVLERDGIIYISEQNSLVEWEALRRAY